VLVKEAKKNTGGLSEPSKMPGYGYGTPARECRAGSKLRKCEGSVCSTCYALKGRYTFSNVQNAQQIRFNLVREPKNRKTWVESMVFLINRHYQLSDAKEFRWFDSGDLQGIWQLELIVEVCRATPKVKHWMPTREYKDIRDYIKKYGSFPKNLAVRYSAHWIDKMPTTVIKGVPFSTVSTADDVFPKAHHCPARHQNNECGSCRACWDPDVEHVDYHGH